LNVTKEMPSHVEDSHASLTGMEVRTVEYVWLWLIDDDEHASGISRAVGIGGRFDSIVGAILPPVVTFWFGILPHLPARKEARAQLVEELKEAFGAKAKLYHGSGPAQVGNVGSTTRFTFGALLQQRSQLLSDLSSLGAGEYREYPEAVDQPSRPMPHTRQG
jgi:hypothetical protein